MLNVKKIRCFVDEVKGDDAFCYAQLNDELSVRIVVPFYKISNFGCDDFYWDLENQEASPIEANKQERIRLKKSLDDLKEEFRNFPKESLPEELRND